MGFIDRRPAATSHSTAAPASRSCASALAAVVCVLVPGCATRTTALGPEDPIGAALEQPFRDLSLLRGEAPAEFVRASSDPYRPSRDCAALAAELDSLDRLLGFDVGVGRTKHSGAGLAGAVVSGATGLPFRGVVRRLTGAHKRDEAIASAVLGAMVRRGFLKGEVVGLGCEGAAP